MMAIHVTLTPEQQAQQLALIWEALNLPDDAPIIDWVLERENSGARLTVKLRKTLTMQEAHNIINATHGGNTP